MVSSFLVILVWNYGDFRHNMYKAEGYIREAGALKSGSAVGEMKHVVLMKNLPEELRLHVRRQVLHNDAHSYEGSGALRMEQATMEDDEEVVGSSFRNFVDGHIEGQGYDQCM